MALKEFQGLKNMEVTMKDGVKVENTKMLDGGATDSPVDKESNQTQQYKTGAIPKDMLGSRNNLNG